MSGTYDVYPAVDDDYSFPPQVRQAIANAPEVIAGTADLVIDPSSVFRQRLDALYLSAAPSGVIDGGSP